MAYKYPNRRGNAGSYGGNSGGGYGNSGGYSNRPQKPASKRSGAKYGTSDKGPYISGWKINPDRTGILSLIASPLTKEGEAKNKKLFGGDYAFIKTSESGIDYERWVCSITDKATGETRTFSGFFDRKAMKLRIPKIGCVASCKKNYFGSSKPPKQTYNNRQNRY